MTERSGWEDLSGLLPESRGWMHSGVAVLSDGKVLCAHPEGHNLLVIDPSWCAETIPTSLTEMHSIVTGDATAKKSSPSPIPGTASSRIPPTRRLRRSLLARARSDPEQGRKRPLELECPPLLDYALESWRTAPTAES